MVETVTVRAEQIEGLRDLIRQVIVEEGERLFPREFLIDVEALRRSPAGIVIRLEERMDHLSMKVEELSEAVESLRAKMEMEIGALRAEMREGQESLRAKMEMEIGALRAEMREGQESLRAKIEMEIGALRAEMREGQESLRAEMRKEVEALRAEMREGQESLRAEFKRELSNLERLMEARFAALEHRLSRTDFWVKFFAGLVSALFVAQLVLTFIR